MVFADFYEHVWDFYRRLYLHFSFSCTLPLDVTDKAVKNSWNSIYPSLFSSNTLNTKDANLLGSPKGKNCLYILVNPWKRTSIIKFRHQNVSVFTNFLWIQATDLLKNQYYLMTWTCWKKWNCINLWYYHLTPNWDTGNAFWITS